MAREISARTRRSARKSIKKKRTILLIMAIVFVLAIIAFWIIKSNKKSESKVFNTPVPTATVSLTITPEQPLSWQEGRQINPKILMYHHVGPLPSDADDIRKGLTVSTENFEKQLKYLKDNNFQVITLNELYIRVAQKVDVSKAAVLTFDDGYEDNFIHALPLLQKYEFKGTFFIISNNIGKAEYMNKDQIQSLATADNEIGSHSVSHPSLEKVSEDKLKKELVQSKEDLEKLTNQQVTSFCYPSGKYSENVILEVKEAGYKIAVTTQKGQAFLTTKPYEIPRYRINPNTNLKNFF